MFRVGWRVGFAQEQVRRVTPTFYLLILAYVAAGGRVNGSEDDVSGGGDGTFTTPFKDSGHATSEDPHP